MSALTIPANSFTTMTKEAVEMARALEAGLRGLPDAVKVGIPASHLIHGGTYSRTIFVPAGIVLVGILVKIATTIIISGHATMTVGDETHEFCGYHVVPGFPGRKQSLITHADTHFTMFFPSSAQTLAEAEAQYSDECDTLQSRADDALNTIIITGA